jgi:predicted dehydrogenase
MKVAIIGAGRMGRRHIQVARNVGLDLVGILDKNRESLAQAKSEAALSDAIMYDDADRIFEEHRPECVIVATTAPSHLQYVCKAVECGAQLVLCEKPMAVSLEDCDRMIGVCQKHGARLAINHQMRFMEQYMEPKRLVNRLEFGGVSSVTVVAGNFGMAMNGTHYFEMFRYITGEPPVEASAWFSKEKVANPRGVEFEDRAGAVRLVTVSGKRFYMDAGHDQGHGMQVTYAGKYGVLWVDELAGQMRLVIRQPEYRGLPTTRYGMPCGETKMSIAPADVITPSEAVLRALIEGKDFPSGEDGRLAVAALVAAHVSNDRGGIPVRIDSGLPSKQVFPWA